MRLLVTRPEPDAERTAETLSARGYAVMLAPLLRMLPIADADIGDQPWSGVLVTSANAIRALAPEQAKMLAGLPLLAVGHQTASAARAAGFRDVRSAAGDAADLVRLAAHAFGGAGGRLLYLTGENQAQDVAAMLAKHGIFVRTSVVYRMAAATQFPQTARAALQRGEIDGVLHYSRRTAEAYLACAAAAMVMPAALGPMQYCVSDAIAVPLAAAGARRLCIAAQPDEDALLRLIGDP